MSPSPDTMEHSHDWLTAALTGGAGLWLLAGAVMCLLGLLLCIAALPRLARFARPTLGYPHRNLLTDATGTTTIEFALVLPVALFLSLALTQTTLLMGGNIFVHYSAFAATRSAIVQIPADYRLTTGEPANEIALQSGGGKFDAIHDAAAISLIPVSGRQQSGGSLGDLGGAIASYYNHYGQPTPWWAEYLAPDRLRYALAQTDVTLMQSVMLDTDGDDQADSVRFDALSGYHAFGPRDPVTVEVQHRFYLSVPYVWFIYSDGELAEGSYYTLMTAQCTLTNEGISDQLPLPPSLPRVDD